MHIASFAGFAPVNNPVIAVAVVIDSPKGALLRHRSLRAGLRRSGAAGARVSGRAARHRSAPGRYGVEKERAARPEDDGDAQDENSEDIQALYQAANDLPSDDPLRQRAGTAGSAPSVAQATSQIEGPRDRGTQGQGEPATRGTDKASERTDRQPHRRQGPRRLWCTPSWCRCPRSPDCLCAR